MTARSEVAGIVDHTLLKPEATAEQFAALVAEAQDLCTYSVCVSPSQLPLTGTGDVKVATVCGFPSGAHHAEVKAAEAARSVADGADEIDMVINLALATTGQFDAVRAEIAAVRAAAPAPVVLKVIIESAALTDEQIVAVCQAAEAASADFVKTSTGFHPAGGVEAGGGLDEVGAGGLGRLAHRDDLLVRQRRGLDDDLEDHRRRRGGAHRGDLRAHGVELTGGG